MERSSQMVTLMALVKVNESQTNPKILNLGKRLVRRMGVVDKDGGK